MKKITVLYIARGAHLYGDNRSLLQLLIQNRTVINEYVCTTEEGLFTEELRKNNIPYSVIDETLLFNFSQKRLSLRVFLGRLRRILVTFWTLTQIIRKIEPNIIHSNNSLIFIGYVMARIFKLPHVWHIREYQTLDHNLKNRHLKLEKQWMRNSFCIGISKGLFDYWGMQKDKDIQLYNGIFSEKELVSYVFEKDNYFLFSGRLVHTKGVHDLVEAFGIFSQENKNFKLIIAGEGDDDYVTYLKNISKSYGISQKVVFCGFVKDMKSLMMNAKALIVPSYFEALGRITIEALLSGCYVIGRNTAGTKEILENEKIGMLFNDIPELVDAMKIVSSLSDKELSDYNMKAIENAKSHYTAEKNALETYNFYLTILKKHHQ